MSITTIPATKFELEAQERYLFSFQKTIEYHAHLFNSEGVLVAWARLVRGSLDFAEGVVLGSIETHPDYRNLGYARSLIEQIRAELGVIHTTGYCSRSGASLIEREDIPLIPRYLLDVQDREDYSFIDWSTGEQRC